MNPMSGQNWLWTATMITVTEDLSKRDCGAWNLIREVQVKGASSNSFRSLLQGLSRRDCGAWETLKDSSGERSMVQLLQIHG